jgi:DnaK suppressor protein
MGVDSRQRVAVVLVKFYFARTAMNLDNLDSDRIRETLRNAKAKLEDRVSTIHDHARRTLNADSAEQAAELGNVEVVSAIEDEATHELAEINAALQRLDSGSYGSCARCGEKIDTERLIVRPASAECLDCANLGH